MIGIKHLINDDIVLERVRIVGSDIEGEMSLSEALDLSSELSLDLVQVGENEGIAICKLMNYEKYLYQQKKIQKNNKKGKQVVKELRLGANIAEHDMKVKAKQATTILKSGDKVKVVIMFKGMEIEHIDLFKQKLDKFLSFIDIDYRLEVDKKLDNSALYSIIVKK